MLDEADRVLHSRLLNEEAQLAVVLLVRLVRCGASNHEKAHLLSLLKDQPGSLQEIPLAFEWRDTPENPDANLLWPHAKAPSQIVHFVSGRLLQPWHWVVDEPDLWLKAGLSFQQRLCGRLRTHYD